MENKMTTGIYMLAFDGTHKVYIGQSKHIEYRFSEHCRDLLGGTHSAKMLEAYTSFGIPEYEILEICEQDNMDALENSHIKLWNSVEDGFNTMYKAGDYPILFGERNPKCNYTNEQILEVVILLAENSLLHIDISNKVGVTKTVVDLISNGTTHTWVKDTLPVEYTKMLSQIGVSSAAKSSKIGSIISRAMRNKKYPDIISPEGIVYEVLNAREFSREHGLGQSALNALLNFKAKSHKGWKLA